MDWWIARMPIQGAPSYDDKLLGVKKTLSTNGVDPENEDRVLLLRNRISRIYYLRKFFDYPISLSMQTIKSLGIYNTISAALGYLRSTAIKIRDESNLENFLINRFGRPLYRMFFESYTEKVWGVKPSNISAEWGAQRIKGLSLSKALIDAIRKIFVGKKSKNIRQKDKETSLIEEFLYPKLGPGQLWEYVASDIKNMGGFICMEHKVVGIQVANNKVYSVTTESNGEKSTIECDHCISSMPIKDLIASIDDGNMQRTIKNVAKGLPYRDFMTVGLLVERLEIFNNTTQKTLNNIIPDTWIYIQESDVRLCRLQVFNNWSPYMVADPNTVWIGLEYMCSETDDIWLMDDASFIDFAISEVEKIGLISRKNIIDSCRIKIEKAYPAYFGSYENFDEVREYLDGLENLYCVGRNGQHRYNNQDHSMLTAMEAVRCIITNDSDKKILWSVNTEQDYHESK
jgi:protoporphyrinogen oxidase